MFKIGCQLGMEKVAVKADVEELVMSTLQQLMPKRRDVSPDDELETLFKEDGKIESVIATLEDELGVKLEPDTAFGLFAEGTVKDLIHALASEVLEKKAYDRGYYMRNRQQIQMRNRQYRARNLMQIRRKARIYRRKVKRRAVRPRKRVGSAAGGYRFVHR